MFMMKLWELLRENSVMPTAPLAEPTASSGLLQTILSAGHRPFFHVVPSETGLTRTIWLSESEKYPVVIVHPEPGRHVHITAECHVVGFDEETPFPDLNEWLRLNRALLAPLAAQEIDAFDFYDEMKPVRPSALTEMVNLPAKRTGLPMMVYCSPDNAGHDMRVKVMLDHAQTWIEEKSTSVALRPNIHMAPNHPKLPTKDFRLVKQWIELNQQTIVDYWEGRLDTSQFKAMLKPLDSGRSGRSGGRKK
jgi:hypothetical protein